MKNNIAAISILTLACSTAAYAENNVIAQASTAVAVTAPVSEVAADHTMKTQGEQAVDHASKSEEPASEGNKVVEEHKTTEEESKKAEKVTEEEHKHEEVSLWSKFKKMIAL